VMIINHCHTHARIRRKTECKQIHIDSVRRQDKKEREWPIKSVTNTYRIKIASLRFWVSFIHSFCCCFYFIIVLFVFFSFFLLFSSLPFFPLFVDSFCFARLFLTSQWVCTDAQTKAIHQHPWCNNNIVVDKDQQPTE
jgi:hypothetical protein